MEYWVVAEERTWLYCIGASPPTYAYHSISPNKPSGLGSQPQGKKINDQTAEVTSRTLERHEESGVIICLMSVANDNWEAWQLEKKFLVNAYGTKWTIWNLADAGPNEEGLR